MHSRILHAGALIALALVAPGCSGGSNNGDPISDGLPLGDLRLEVVGLEVYEGKQVGYKIDFMGSGRLIQGMKTPEANRVLVTREHHLHHGEGPYHFRVYVDVTPGSGCNAGDPFWERHREEMGRDIEMILDVSVEAPDGTC